MMCISNTRCYDYFFRKFYSISYCSNLPNTRSLSDKMSVGLVRKEYNDDYGCAFKLHEFM